MKKKKNTVLITGAAGFIGRNTAKHFNKNGWQAIGISLEKLDKKESGRWGLQKYHSGKISKKVLLKVEEKPDLIIHCAGSGSIGFSLKNPKKDFEMNVGSLRKVLEFMRSKCPGARLIYPSSTAVYGQKDDVPIKENDPLAPVSPYGLHKKMAEELCEEYSKKYNLNISIVRLFSAYGPGLQKQLLWDASHKICGNNEEIVFFGTGLEKRDWIHVRDIAGLFLVLAQSKNKFETVNGGSGAGITIKDVISMLLKAFKKDKKIIFNKAIRKGDPRYYRADIKKAALSGWKPKVSLQAGIKEYVNHFRKNNG